MKHRYPYTVATFDGGADQKLSLSGLLRINQEAGECHMRSIGLPYGVLREKGIAFLIVRLATNICALPALGDEIFCETWSGGVQGASLLRYYSGKNAAGERLWDTCAVLVAIDVVNGKLLRPSAIDWLDQFAHGEADGCVAPGKLRAPEELPLVGVREIRHSDIDVNAHWNNTKYADMLYDFLPGEMAPVQSFAIQFSREALLGDQVEIAAQRLDGDVLWMQGSHARGVCFSASAVLRP